ncbi:MAG: hypothetical protein RLZZ600_456 [Actinomycetota bacterium]
MLTGQTLCASLCSWLQHPAGVLEILLPEKCVLCDKPPRALCPTCLATMISPVRWHQLNDVPLASSSADEVQALRLLRAFKDDCRTGLSHPLSTMLEPVLRQAIERHGWPDVFVVPPSPWRSWRRRGFRPVPLILRRLGIRSAGVIKRSRGRDQRGLTLYQRALNVAGLFRVPTSLYVALRGARVMLVDDVVTTGATLREAVRALEAAGASVVCAIALVRIAPRRKN